MASYTASKSKKYRDSGKSLHQSQAKIDRVNYFLDVLEMSYDRYKPTLDRLQSLNNTYENVVDGALFPTTSKMSIPNHFGMVQEALPNALDMVFPDASRTYTLTPLDVDIDMETLDRVEYVLNYTVRNRMRAKWTALPTLQDAIKTGIGYAAVVPKIVTPPVTLNQRFVQGGRVVRQARAVGVGAPKRQLSLEYVGLGEVIPTPDGVDFNGVNPASHVFRVKIYTEDQFRRLMAKVKADTEDIDVSGDVEAIIAQAGDFNFTTNVPLPQIIANLGGVDLTDRSLKGEKEYTLIPVIQCYGEHEHCWIANGTTEIYYEKDTLQTLHRPLLKASVTVDAQRWHPMNPAEAGAAIASGKNLYTNLLMDLMIRAVKPVMLYDKDRFGNKPPVVGRNGEIGVSGAVTNAIDFPAAPQLNNGHIAFDNLLDRLYGHAVGQSASMQDPSPGMLRGGLHALESLLNTMYGRQRLAAMIMEMGFVEPLGQLAMIHMQIGATGEGETVMEREYDQDTGEGRVRKTTITPQDLMAAFDVTIDPRAKANTTTDLNERLAVYQATQNSPYYDPYTREEFLVGAYPHLRAGLYSREKARQIQEQRAEQERMAAQQEAASQEQAQAGMAGGPPGGTLQAIERGAVQA